MAKKKIKPVINPDGTYSFNVKPYRGKLLHITVGIPDQWEPTPEDLDAVAGMFMQSGKDPEGTVIVTRTGITCDAVEPCITVEVIDP